MSDKPTRMYSPSLYGKGEEQLMKKYFLQKEDAKFFFENQIKPRLDRSYKLYIAYNGDRQREIKKWQSNVFIPYVQSVVETLMPRVLDARPEFIVQGRTEDDQLKSKKLVQLSDFTWEVSKADEALEDTTRASMVYGTGFMQASWKKDERELEFLRTNLSGDKRLEWKKEKKVFYDAPYVEWVDNYSLWYDWHAIKPEDKQFWFKRLLLTGEQIRRRYKIADKERLAMALSKGAPDLTDYAAIRSEVKSNHEEINKNSGANVFGARDGINRGIFFTQSIYEQSGDPELDLHEVFEWWRPFDDKYAVMVNDVPILPGGQIPIPYNFKAAPFIAIPYLRPPGEFEGYGIPMILENPQIMLNTIKNQRIDAVTMNIHKMWIVNPLANVNKNELVVRPFGIIYSNDPNGVREVQFSDVKSSAYQEEESIKSDMRYASGVDDFSMGAGGSAGSATEVRHLRESTLERVRLFVNHIGYGLGTLMEYWVSMYEQFFTKEMVIRIVGDDGAEAFPIIEKDDLMGHFDFKALVNPSIAGQNDVEKKQIMDLFQLLVNMPFIDQQKLTSQVLHKWNMDMEGLVMDQVRQGENAPGGIEEMLGMGAPQGPPGMPPGGAPTGPMPPGGAPPSAPLGIVPPEVAAQMDSLMGVAPGGGQSIEQMLGQIAPSGAGGGMPDSELIKENLRGHNRGGKVDTNIPTSQSDDIHGRILNKTYSNQK